MNSPTVFVVDDDPAILDSIRSLLDTVGIASKCYENAESFLSELTDDQAGCVVLDVRMGEVTGQDVHAELIRRGSHLPVIYLTAYGDIPMTVSAMKAGATDFLTKPIDGSKLLDHIQAAVELDLGKLASKKALSLSRQRIEELSPRELEVAQLVATGESSKKIARRLGISHRTVEIHRSNILRKTGTASVLELAQLFKNCEMLHE